MPELPEVETVRRTLAPFVTGRAIATVSFTWPPTAVGDPRTIAARLTGQRIERLERFGKYLLFRLRRDGRGSLLIVHLRMTGNLVVNEASGAHTRARMSLDDGTELVFHDIRKFGRWQWATRLPARLAALGPDPLAIGPDEFATRLRSRRARLKALLLDQAFLRGLGNIYADEALFRARLHPLRSAASVGPRKARGLHRAIQAVLREAIGAGGTSIRDYRDGRGERGAFQRRIRIYGRAGAPCISCGARVERVLVAQRSTHFCPRCQRRA
ncbi:MAG: bifunctional DNA-formamidopyrimidine glycosylase/DNA-(apurinic or apyrimidinic site) lyase [Acidobacteria bacterium]|nr:bifunctional DNA-formamidopyrimidine glycosylase/DNA-(apurinic or apyrimidinic site) lyase [Acidobacteriota bacterium]